VLRCVYAAIGVPLQRAVLEEKGDELSTRHLSLNDLLGQITHYSATVRKGTELQTVELLVESLLTR